ncbi:hypothetical protein BU16DRAFT_528680 [Lophium mytilinum]|uniref:Uncharacterized protein n=1 Tax=Lophium mytilinum TaxID=390894 RepID=A0A6A6QLX6_9PEZI|nr:hypothetical protein BU16DRAFT_528680 [Lophium mytilinum]
MPKFDDRVARQNRCEPPLEFPLAAPYPSTAHHRSSPNSYALTQPHRAFLAVAQALPHSPSTTRSRRASSQTRPP